MRLTCERVHHHAGTGKSLLFKRAVSVSSIVGCWTRVSASSVRLMYSDTHTSPLSTHSRRAHTAPWASKPFEGVAKPQGVLIVKK